MDWLPRGFSLFKACQFSRLGLRSQRVWEVALSDEEGALFRLRNAGLCLLTLNRVDRESMEPSTPESNSWIGVFWGRARQREHATLMFLASF